jgi:hypothetical protein
MQVQLSDGEQPRCEPQASRNRVLLYLDSLLTFRMILNAGFGFHIFLPRRFLRVRAWNTRPLASLVAY